MKFLALALIFVANTSMAAISCPNFSGMYSGTVTWVNGDVFEAEYKIEQQACSKVTVTSYHDGNEGTKIAYPIGQVIYVEGIPGFGIFSEGKFITSWISVDTKTQKLNTSDISVYSLSKNQLRIETTFTRDMPEVKGSQKTVFVGRRKSGEREVRGPENVSHGK